MGKLQWGDQIRNFSLLREIMTILRRSVTFTFYIIEFCLNLLSKNWKTSKNSIFFRLCMLFFAVWGCLLKMSLLLDFFCKRFFWDQSWLEKTPPTSSLDFFQIFWIVVFDICIYLRNWGVKVAMWKISECLNQNWQRNKLSKLATFEPIFQLPHSAMSLLIVR